MLRFYILCVMSKINLKYLVATSVLILFIVNMPDSNRFGSVSHLSSIIPSAVAQPSTVTSSNSTNSSNNTIGGGIDSSQTSNQGSWVVGGHFILNLSKPLEQSSSSNPPMAKLFNATFYMVMLNGKGLHQHKIYDFKQNASANGNGSATFNGTATITMKDGAHTGVPIGIKIMSENTKWTVVAIQPDKAMTKNHFGDTPIYGIITPPPTKR